MTGSSLGTLPESPRRESRQSGLDTSTQRTLATYTEPSGGFPALTLYEGAKRNSRHEMRTWQYAVQYCTARDGSEIVA